jgi:hypothetical protein
VTLDPISQGGVECHAEPVEVWHSYPLLFDKLKTGSVEGGVWGNSSFNPSPTEERWGGLVIPSGVFFDIIDVLIFRPKTC